MEVYQDKINTLVAKRISKFGISRQKLADHLGLSKTYIDDFEGGKYLAKTMNRKAYTQLKSFYGSGVDDVIKGVNNRS